MFNDFESIKIGDSAVIEKKITETDVRRFVEMTGDDNPLHVDRKFAETTPFKDVVVHGMLGASFISTIIGTKLPGTGALWISQTLDFLLPVRLGDVLRIVCTVKSKNDRERVLDLDTVIYNQLKQTILSGHGRVKVLQSQKLEADKPDGEKIKVAIVTGASGGIGRAICVALAKRGYKVVVNYSSNEAQARNVVDTIIQQGGVATAHGGDISREQDARAIVEQAWRKYGGVSLLVNNAAPKINPKAFDALDWDDFEKHISVQVKGAFHMTKACVPHMKKQGYGRIVNITSQILDGVPTPNWTSYAVAKSALATYSKFLAVELGPSGINVNCVSPGMTETSLIGDIPEKARLIVARQTPLRRLAKPEDVAAAVVFLSSDEAGFITGETVRVNGGQVMI